MILSPEGKRNRRNAVKVTYDQQLKDYMNKKGYAHIELGMVQANTCCSGFADVYTGFLTAKGAEKLKGKIVRRIPGEVGDILVTERGLEFADEIHLGLKSFLGAKDITVEGVRDWSM
jgi:hypothetical protein